MININLLPEALRKKERMPLPHFLGLIAGIALFGGVLYMITKYQFDIIPGLESQVAGLESERSRLQRDAEELKKLNAEIAKLDQLVNAVKSLYRNRIVWAKILSDIKSIVNFDPEMGAYNLESRYLWYTSITGRGKNLQLKGYATASNQIVAMQMPERLLERFKSYSPEGYPEKNEEVRLQDELRNAIKEYEELRRENPELPIQGPKEISVRQRLEEIKNIKSGGIALTPFNELLTPNSITLISTTWTTAPQPRSRRDAVNEIFPDRAWDFTISMQLK